MASFTFNGAAGTQLPTIDANWTVDDAGLGKYWETKGSYLDATANFASPYARYVNGHGAAQLSKITIQTGSTLGVQYTLIQNQGSGTVGYAFFLASAGNWQFRRNGAFVTSGTHAENDTTADYSLSVEIDGSGNYTLKVNATTVGTGTDGTPLTGGYPGFVGFNGASVTEMRVLDWTDGVATNPVITAQPTDQTVNAGASPTFSATATGATSQRWQDNSGGSFADIGGATSTSYSPGTVGYAQQGRRYRIIFTNAGGDTTSAEAVLRVEYNLTGTGARRRQTFASAPFASTGPLGAPSAGGPISATPGTYTWVGPAATLAVQSIAATPGTYTWVGAAASIALQQIAATPGAYTWVGPAASFPVPQISATPGTYTWVGSAATFPVPQVAATPGAYVWVGPVAVITTPASATVVDATPGPYNWVGAAVTFPVPQVAVTPGTYTWVGPAAVITTPPAGVTTIDSTPGPYVWAGTVATFPIQTLSATPGTYTWTGASATFAIATVEATPGAWAWTGPLAGIVQLVNIDATPGSWAWTGRQASIDNGGDAERFVFWAGFAQAQRRRDRERERVEAEELAQRVATRAIQEARAASARVSTQAAIDRARREAKEASARMTAALKRMILAALAIEENNRLAEIEEEELAAMMLLQIAAGD